MVYFLTIPSCTIHALKTAFSSQSYRGVMDPLSDVLRFLEPDSYGFRGLSAQGDWCLEFPEGPGLKCQAIQTGVCWIEVDGLDAPVQLEAGDLVLLSGQHAFRTYTNRTVSPLSAYDVLLSVAVGHTAVLNGGGHVTGMGGFFKFKAPYAERMLSELPPLIHIRPNASGSTMKWAVEQLMSELRQPEIGSALLAAHLAQMLLIQGLRLHITSSTQGTGWLYALRDPRLHAALCAIHKNPEAQWTLQTLAGISGMSRTSFAAHFKAIIGETCMNYLTQWRMTVASHHLAKRGISVARAAELSGYSSESAFSAAFKRVMGQVPSNFSKDTDIRSAVTADRIKP
ncbi:AraC family transcriptional regulator [Gluconobacter albidus]|nr:AraC family transcriptional regulator [Gluconobacter albidus]MBS1028955.1 AraC family transcriptional regulator [Gluconobacter albidus]